MALEHLFPGFLNFKAQSAGKWFALTDAATIAVDINASDFFFVTLAGNRTLGAPTNAPAAGTLQAARKLFRIRQDGTGTRTLVYNAAYRFPDALAPTLSTGAGKSDYLAFIWNEIDSVYDLVGSRFNL
jgi:hypothetical protein